MKQLILSILSTTLISGSLLALDPKTPTKENLMKPYTIVQKPSILLMGITCRTSNVLEAGPIDIPNLWGKFYADNVIGKISNKTSNEVLALYFDYEGDHTKPYSILIGCPVSSADVIPEGMTVKSIPEGSYALFQAIGEHPKALIETWGTIWQTNLKRTYTGDYEVYGQKFIPGSDQEVEIFIAL